MKSLILPVLVAIITCTLVSALSQSQQPKYNILNEDYKIEKLEVNPQDLERVLDSLSIENRKFGEEPMFLIQYVKDGELQECSYVLFLEV